MIRPCKLTEKAGELCSDMIARSIPQDFVLSGDYWQVMADFRHDFTNYDALVEALPDCPMDCPIAASMDEPSGPSCFNYDLAHDMLRTDARWLAMRVFDEWYAKKKDQAEAEYAPAF
jgi:hypothetical protein